MDLSIIIVSFNTREYLGNCIQSIFDNAGHGIKYEIIVVDNNSSDGTHELIKNYTKKHHNFKAIFNKDNLGYSKANNQGVSQSSGRYVLFLNSDTLIQKNTLEEMIAFMEKHHDAGAATCFVELPDGQLDDAAHRGFPTPWNSICQFVGLSKLMPGSLFFNGYHLGWKDLAKVHEIDALAGAFMIVRRTAGEVVRWWDEDYFFYGEDIDFCYKLKQKGWKIYFVPSTKIFHYKGLSSGIKSTTQKITRADRDTRKKITYARFEAMKIFYNKHYKNKYNPILTSLVLTGINLKQRVALYFLK